MSERIPGLTVHGACDLRLAYNNLREAHAVLVHELEMDEAGAIALLVLSAARALFDVYTDSVPQSMQARVAAMIGEAPE